MAHSFIKFFPTLLLLVFFYACGSKSKPNVDGEVLKPDFVTDPTPTDTDDPAIWIHPTDPEKSLILGTDKGDDNGGVFVFNLDGKLLKEKSVTGLPRPNNIDVEYGFILNGDTIDIAVFAQRNGDNIRVLRVPEMAFIDNGGIDAFKGEEVLSPMGIGLYKAPENGNIYAFVSRKSGPDGRYLWQYLLKDSMGIVIAEPVRKFGAFKGGKEIEAIAVDDEMGYVYYSDEGAGVRKYHAHPDSSNTELAFFANHDFADDHEGISIYKQPGGKGYILVSDQQANRFHVFTRTGTSGNPHEHKRIGILPLSTTDSDGSEVCSAPLGKHFPKGLFVAMSADKTFQIYRWEQLEARLQKGMMSE
jgi:3-phytase